MSMEIDNELNDELEDEYDFASMKDGVRGKYANQYHEGVKLIMLEPDVAKIFTDANQESAGFMVCSGDTGLSGFATVAA